MKLQFRILFPLLLVAAGCTLGPDPERPRTAADEADSYANAAPVPSPSCDELSPWWTRFGDEATVELVELALEYNSDLRVAAANVLEAEASLRMVRSSRWPQVDYSVAGSRSEIAFDLPGQGLVSVEATNYSTALGVSYQVDLFGKLRRSRQSAWASLLSHEAAADTVMHSVIAAVVRARVLVATTERSLAIARDIRGSWRQTLETVERRYRSGLVQPMDVYLARENLSAVEASEAALKASVARARHALDVLVGRRPGSGPRLPNTLSDLPELEPVPVGLPIELLDRRPDLRGSEFQLAAATYGVGVALADLYPDLSLNASYGTSSEIFADLVDLASVVYRLVGNLVGPLFTGGARRAEVAAAEARLEAAAASYAGAVLNALREVENALATDASNIERWAFSERRLNEARAADRLARDRYQRGVENLLTVLETERRMRSAEEAAMATRADLWNTRIDLFLALGGDWVPAGLASETAEHTVHPNPKPIDREVS